MATYEYRYRLGITDIGKSNKITNKAILKILENAGGMHSDALGYGINDIPRTKKSWVLLNWKVEVLERPIYNEELKVITWARDTNKVTTYRDYEIYDESNKLIIRATSRWALINIDTKALTLLDKEMIEKYEPEEKTAFDYKTNEKLKEPQQYSSKLDYKILRSDIDINEHVHNLNYIDFAYEVLPEKIYKSDELNNIEIMYKKQIKFDDDIVCLYSNENNQHTVSIKSKDGKVLHSIIKLY